MQKLLIINFRIIMNQTCSSQTQLKMWQMAEGICSKKNSRKIIWPKVASRSHFLEKINFIWINRIMDRAPLSLGKFSSKLCPNSTKAKNKPKDTGPSSQKARICSILEKERLYIENLTKKTHQTLWTRSSKRANLRKWADLIIFRSFPTSLKFCGLELTKICPKMSLSTRIKITF